MENFEITKSPTMATATKAASSSQLSIISALITLAQFMTVVDFTIVQVALPSIGREFGVSVNGLQWIVTAYGLTLAGFLLLSGRVGEMYGRKKLFIIGVLVFSFASLTGGIAPSEIVLILARVVQGLGAAMASATGLSILAAAFHEGKERNRALSVFAAASGSGFAAGMNFTGVGALVTSAIISARLVNRFGVKPIIISGMALQTIAYLLLSPISTERYIGGLLGPMLLVGVGYGLAITAINIAALTGTRRGEEGLASGLINTSRQIGGPIGLAVLLTVANFETSVGTGPLAVHSVSAMVLGFGYAFLVAALLTVIGIIIAALLKQQRHSQAGLVGTAIAVHQS